MKAPSAFVGHLRVCLGQSKQTNSKTLVIQSSTAAALFSAITVCEIVRLCCSHMLITVLASDTILCQCVSRS